MRACSTAAVHASLFRILRSRNAADPAMGEMYTRVRLYEDRKSCGQCESPVLTQEGVVLQDTWTEEG